MIFLKIHIFFHSFNYTAQNVVLISIHILFRKGEKTEKKKEGKGRDSDSRRVVQLR
jgi:hypothetical protein